MKSVVLCVLPFALASAFVAPTWRGGLAFILGGLSMLVFCAIEDAEREK